MTNIAIAIAFYDFFKMAAGNAFLCLFGNYDETNSAHFGLSVSHWFGKRLLQSIPPRSEWEGDDSHFITKPLIIDWNVYKNKTFKMSDLDLKRPILFKSIPHNLSLDLVNEFFGDSVQNLFEICEPSHDENWVNRYDYGKVCLNATLSVKTQAWRKAIEVDRVGAPYPNHNVDINSKTMPLLRELYETAFIRNTSFLEKFAIPIWHEIGYGYPLLNIIFANNVALETFHCHPDMVFITSHIYTHVP